MRRRLAVCIPLAALLAAGLWPREQVGDAAAPAGAGREGLPVRVPSPLALALPPPPDRNLFAFADAPPTGASQRRPVQATLAPGPSLDAPGVRLVGFVRRGGQTLVALAVSGDVAVLAVGEEFEGVRVEVADEELGVDVRLADGTRRRLAVSR